MNSDDERALHEESAYLVRFLGVHHVLTCLEGWHDLGLFRQPKNKNWDRTATMSKRFDFKNHGGDIRAERLVTQFKGFHLVSTPSLPPQLSESQTERNRVY
jgi:hypothetical protein